MSIYDDLITGITSDDSSAPLKPGLNNIIIIDIDKGETLAEIIIKTKMVIDEIESTKSLNVLIYGGGNKLTSFDWMDYISYLKNTNRQYNFIYRGKIIDISFLMCFDIEYINVYLSKYNTLVNFLTKHNFSFNIIES